MTRQELTRLKEKMVETRKATQVARIEYRAVCDAYDMRYAAGGDLKEVAPKLHEIARERLRLRIIYDQADHASDVAFHDYFESRDNVVLDLLDRINDKLGSTP